MFTSFCDGFRAGWYDKEKLDTNRYSYGMNVQGSYDSGVKIGKRVVNVAQWAYFVGTLTSMAIGIGRTDKGK